MTATLIGDVGFYGTRKDARLCVTPDAYPPLTITGTATRRQRRLCERTGHVRDRVLAARGFVRVGEATAQHVRVTHCPRCLAQTAHTTTSVENAYALQA